VTPRDAGPELISEPIEVGEEWATPLAQRLELAVERCELEESVVSLLVQADPCVGAHARDESLDEATGALGPGWWFEA
jgi:hypothetical protein